MREFGFELSLCATLEAEGRLVSRQLGTSTRGRRVMDVLLVEPGPDFDARTRITPHAIPDAVIAADIGTGRWRSRRAVVAAIDRPTEPARAAVDRALELGFLERQRRDGTEYVRQAVRYPDWFSGLVGIENKPDLGRPGDLATQLRKDVSLGLLDRVVLCTGSYVTRAHLNRIPDAVGVWRFDGAGYEVVRDPSPLAPDAPGIEVVEERPSETRIDVVTRERKTRLRRRLAERAYGKGWRVPLPDCPNLETRTVRGVGPLPYCTRLGRLVGSEDPCDCPPDGAPIDHDIDAHRDRHSPWVRDPTGVTRHQSGLDAFR